jgi:transcriptional regulator with XRE-family HTH domain
MAERLVPHRTSLGLMQKDAAARVGVDQSTLARWERGEREPIRNFTAMVTAYLSLAQPQGPLTIREAV